MLRSANIGVLLTIVSILARSTGEPPNSTDYFQHHANVTDEILRNKRALKNNSPVLKEVGLFMAAHKYLAKDVRYKSREILGDRTFFRHFPIPRLKKMDPELREACSKNANNCINTVYSKAVKFNNNNLPTHPYWPFLDKLHLFNYRTTASYFLCMFTLERNAAMKNVMTPGECLQGFSEKKEAKQTGVTITDFRKDDVSFQCSQIYFCPDPCYGRKTNGNLKTWFSLNFDQGNPCRRLKTTKCDWSADENKDFDGLIRNKFNITCACHLEKTGFKWSSRFKMCVDRDECYEKAVVCEEDKVCLNTKGGYKCVCGRGKQINSKTGQCEDMVLLPKLVNAKSRRRKKKEKMSILRRLEILLGVSSTGVAVSSATWHIMISLGIIWINLPNY